MKEGSIMFQFVEVLIKSLLTYKTWPPKVSQFRNNIYRHVKKNKNSISVG